LLFCSILFVVIQKMSKKLIVVFGATGRQGGSVVDALLKAGKWKVRGITRDPTSEVAKALTQKGVEVIKANSSIKEDLEKAIDGAYGVFALTNFWDKDIYGKQNFSEEQRQAELMADVSLAKGVEYFIFSSLHNVKEISKGTLSLPHWTGKNLAEQYARKLSKENPKFVSSFFYAGCYVGNIFSWPKRDPEGVVHWTNILKTDTPVPIFVPEDTGPIVAYMFDRPQELSGKYVHGASEYITPAQVLNIYDRVTGDKSVYHFVEPELMKGKFPDELIENMIWINDYGYYHGEDISATKKMHPEILSFEGWLKKTGWKVK